jgi:dCTP deaminase
MSVLAAQDIEWEIDHDFLKIEEFHRTKQIAHGMSYGLSAAGYDVRIALPNKDRTMLMPGQFMLAVTKEFVHLPDDLICFVHDKSTLARMGLAVQNTVLEPGWYGFTTLELTNHSEDGIMLYDGQPIAQFIFHTLTNPTNKPYSGKYQNQPAEAVTPIFETGRPEHES